MMFIKMTTTKGDKFGVCAYTKAEVIINVERIVAIHKHYTYYVVEMDDGNVYHFNRTEINKLFEITKHSLNP